MPIRRRLANAFQAASPILGHFRDQAIEGEQADARNTLALVLKQLEEAGANSRASMSANTATQGLLASHPDLANRLSGSGQTQLNATDITPFVQGTTERLAPLAKAIAGATSPEAVPTDADLSSQASGVGVGAPDISTLLAQAAAKRQQQQAAFEQSRVASMDQYNPATGATERQIGSQTLQTSPTPTQKGLNTTTEALTGELSPTYARAKADSDAIVEDITRASKARTAAATTSASQHAMMAPDLVQARVDEALAKKSAENRAPTQAQAQNKMRIPTLLNADAQSSELEKAGAFITPTAMLRQTNLVANALGGASDATLGRFSPTNVDPLTARYMQSAIDFANIHTLIMSGTQTREEELPRFLQTFFVTKADRADPKLVLQKQLSRKIFAGAARAVAEGSADPTSVGAYLGHEILAGRLSQDVLGFDLTPEVKAGLMQVLGQ